MLKRFFCLAILFFSMQPIGAATLDDFAYAIPIHVEKNKDLYAFSMPTVVYQQVTQANLADIRIFNADGDAVPFQIKQQELQQDLLKQKADFFPVYADVSSNSDLSLALTQHTGDSHIDIKSSDSIGEKAVQGYLVPIGKFQGKIFQEIELQWSKRTDTWVADAEVKQSDDLKHWQNISSQCTALANVNYKGSVRLRNKIPLEKINKKFLLIKWCGEPPKGIDVKNIYVNVTKEHQDVLQWIILSPLASVERNTLKYNSKGYFPTVALNLKFAEKNNSLTVQFYSKDRLQSKWGYIKSGFFYDIEVQGKTIDGEPLRISRHVTPLWRMEIAKKSTVKPPYPELKIGWLPAKVTFLAKGKPPFVLAFGSGSEAVKVEETGLEDIVNKFNSENKPIAIPQLGEMYTIAGKKALATKIDWRNCLLWFFLVIGVLFICFMSYKVIVELRRK